MAVGRVLVSMLNFNSDDAGVATLESLSQQDHDAMDLIVFDNASVDGSREAISARFPKVQVINTGKNLGYCGGNNAALDYGLAHGYDAVVIANHDLRVGPDAVRRMVSAARAHPNAGVIGAQEIDGATGTPRVLGGRGYDFWRSRRLWIRDPGELGAPADAPLTMDYVQGAFLMLTKPALERGVRLSDDMFAYADEIELGIQLRAAGFDAVVDPRVHVWHTSRGKSFGPVEGYFLQRNRWYLVRHHGSLLQQIVCLAYMSLIEVPGKAALRLAQGHGRFARATVLGFIDGLRGVTGIGRAMRV